MKSTYNPAHVGRRWNGPDRLSYECDCPKQPCGLTLVSDWLPDCPFHQMTKTIRQGHAAEDCPGVEEMATNEPEDPWWM